MAPLNPIKVLPLIVVNSKTLTPGSKYHISNEGIFPYCSDLELLRWWVLAVRSLGLPGTAVVLVKGVPEGRFWREVVDRRLVLR